MLNPFGQYPFQRVEPGGELHAGHAVQQVRADIGEAAGPCPADRRHRVRAGMEPLEKAERIRLQALHPQAQPVDTSLEPPTDVLAGDIAGVRFECDLSA